MVPSAFHWRETLPLTGNGKIDRTVPDKALPESSMSSGGLRRAAYADREAAGSSVGEGARHPAGADRPA